MVVSNFKFCYFDLSFSHYLQFAYCYPYTYSHLQVYLEGAERLRLDYCSRELLCLSVVSWRRI